MGGARTGGEELGGSVVGGDVGDGQVPHVRGHALLIIIPFLQSAQ